MKCYTGIAAGLLFSVVQSFAGADLVMSAGTRIVFGDGSIQNTASSPPAGHGGLNNTVAGARAFVGGGQDNSASGDFSMIGGGIDNAAIGYSATIAGGTNNQVGDGFESTIGGGYYNTANSDYSTVSGGASNAATAFAATVPGGYANTAGGEYSFAAGRLATISSAHSGTFLFADSLNANFDSLRGNEFAARARGGVRFITNSAGTSGLVILPGGSSWLTPSSKTIKENQQPVDAVAILEKLVSIPVEQWNYSHEEADIRHIGPYAEDFHAAFGLNGPYIGRIATQDVEGVALSAIQGLNLKLEQFRASQEAKDAVIDALVKRIDELESKASKQ